MQASTTHLPHRAVLRVAGPDWAPFLKGLCTAHIDVLAAETSAGTLHRLHYGAFLRPQGKMYADVLLHAAAPDDIRLDVPRSSRDELVAKLTMYRMRAKVTIEALDTPVMAAFGGDLPDGCLSDPRGDIVGDKMGRAYMSASANATPDAWTAFRFTHGLACLGEDFAADALYAIDANLDALGGIDFHKGCYVGQELTSRMKRRGQIKNRILPLSHIGRQEPGAEVLNGDVRAGVILGSIDRQSLALMRLDRLDGQLTSDGVMVTLATPSWLAPQLLTNV